MGLVSLINFYGKLDTLPGAPLVPGVMLHVQVTGVGDRDVLADEAWLEVIR